MVLPAQYLESSLDACKERRSLSHWYGKCVLHGLCRVSGRVDTGSDYLIHAIGLCVCFGKDTVYRRCDILSLGTQGVTCLHDIGRCHLQFGRHFLDQIAGGDHNREHVRAQLVRNDLDPVCKAPDREKHRKEHEGLQQHANS